MGGFVPIWGFINYLMSYFEVGILDFQDVIQFLLRWFANNFCSFLQHAILTQLLEVWNRFVNHWTFLKHWSKPDILSGIDPNSLSAIAQMVILFVSNSKLSASKVFKGKKKVFNNVCCSFGAGWKASMLLYLYMTEIYRTLYPVAKLLRFITLPMIKFPWSKAKVASETKLRLRTERAL